MSLGFNHHGAITRSFCAGRITLVCICLVYGFPGATWATSLGHHPQVKEATPQQEAPGPSVIAQKGPLEEIKGPLQELTDFASVEGRLELKMKASYQEAMPTVNRIRELGGWGGNSSSSGSGRFSFHMDGNKLAGVIKRGPVEGGIENSILLEEKSQPFRKFEISGTTLGTISINIKSNEPHYLLRLRQLSDGQILVQEIDQDQIYAGTAPNFSKFCLRHRHFCSEKLGPLLEHFGLGPIPTPYDSTIQEKFIAIITPWSDSELSQMQKFTSALDADNYKERESASKSIREELKEIELMLRFVNDPQFRPEARSRIRKMIYEHAELKKKNEIVFFEELLANVNESYLSDLINLQNDPIKKSVLLDKLRETSPKFSDPGLTEKEILARIAERPLGADSESPSSDVEWGDTPDLLEPRGHFQKVKNSVGALIKLTPHQDSAKIDRGHWKTLFDGREIQELSDEVKKLLSDNNLPASWYNPGGTEHAVASASHPQVLFEKLAALGDGEQKSTTRTYYKSHRSQGPLNPNRQFDKQAMQGRLTFDKTIMGNVRRARDYKKSDVTTSPLMIELVEKLEPRRTLMVEETSPGNLNLLIIHEDADSIVKLDLRNESATVIDIRGDTIRTFTAESFNKLISNEAVFFEKEFFPLVQHLGIQISDDFQSDAD